VVKGFILYKTQAVVMLSLWVFLGAGLGGVARFWLVQGIHALWGRELAFPLGTLLVNVTGSFIMGLLFSLMIDKWVDLAPTLRALLLVGFLGGYTTFSSFSLETFTLLEHSTWSLALLNIALNVILSISCTWAGIALGKAWVF
tara:strand:- start:5112 stop:5540 length:429 start_codon:yes stop_codon:yes gene_type:complete